MVARMSPLFELSTTALSTVMIIGAITALFMGFLGIIQNDIKRVIAYSTLSQLGYMTVALGASAYSVAIFHLMTHAFFKALLFLAAGAVIMAMHHDGVEVEATWQPTRALQMIASYGYDDTEILNSGCVINATGDPNANHVGAQPDPTCPAQTAGVPQNLRGNPLPNAPKNKLALNANYTFFFDPGSLSLSATYAWRDVQYGSIFATPYNRAPAWDQVDLRAEWKSSNGHYSIIA